MRLKFEKWRECGGGVGSGVEDWVVVLTWHCDADFFDGRVVFFRQLDVTLNVIALRFNLFVDNFFFVHGERGKDGGREEEGRMGVGLVAQGNHKEITKKKWEVGPVLFILEKCEDYFPGTRRFFLSCGHVPKSRSIPVGGNNKEKA